MGHCESFQELLSKFGKSMTNSGKTTKDQMVCRIIKNWNSITKGKQDQGNQGDDKGKGSDDKETL